MPVKRKEMKGNISRKCVLPLSETLKGVDMSYGDIRGIYWHIDKLIWFMIEKPSIYPPFISLRVRIPSATIKSMSNFHRITLAKPFSTCEI